MGPCFSSVYDEMERACTAVKDPSWKLSTIQAILSRPEGEDYDVFRLIHKVKYTERHHDCITLFLSETRDSWTTGDTIDTAVLPFLQLMRKQIQNNRTTAAKKNKNFTTPQLHNIEQPYIEFIVDARYGRGEEKSSLKLFRFFLDNSEYFPLSRPNKEDNNNNNNDDDDDNSSSNINNNTLLHRLCQRDGKGNVEMLREYISSGFIEDCFNNSDNDGDRMKMFSLSSSEQYTPLEVACMQNKVEVVEELVVNKIGGRNYGAAIHLLLKPHHVEYRTSFPKSIPSRESVQHKIVAICLLFLSQPGATQIIQKYVPNLVWFAEFSKLPDVEQCLLDNGIVKD